VPHTHIVTKFSFLRSICAINGYPFILSTSIFPPRTETAMGWYALYPSPPKSISLPPNNTHVSERDACSLVHVLFSYHNRLLRHMVRPVGQLCRRQSGYCLVLVDITALGLIHDVAEAHTTKTPTPFPRHVQKVGSILTISSFSTFRTSFRSF
jgi:hypothetical protein